MKKKVVICIYGNVSQHPRVLMEIEALKKDFSVTCVGLGPFSSPGIEYINIENIFWPKDVSKKADLLSRIPHFLLRIVYKFSLKPLVYSISRLLYSRSLKKTKEAESLDYVPAKVFKALSQARPDLLIIHSPNLLPLGARFAKKRIPVIFNAHEYYPEILSSNSEWDSTQKARIVSLLKTYLPKVNALLTISGGIQKKYESEFSVRSVLIRSAKPYHELTVGTYSDTKIKLVHHGSSVPIRKLEESIDVIDHLPENYTLDLYLLPVYKEYHEHLLTKYKDHPRIKFNEIVPTDKIPFELNKFDIGLCMLPPVNFNLEMTLPNKFFEFIQARLAIVSGPSPEIKSIIEKYDLGKVSSEFTTEALAQTILSISPKEISHYKSQAHKHALELSFETELSVINNLAKTLVSEPELKLL